MTPAQDLTDYVWERLAAHPIRRAMLGRERCDAIATVAQAKLAPDGLLAARYWGPVLKRTLIADVERQVRDEYDQRSGFAFTTMLVMWAIGIIVQIVVQRWLEPSE
jgi:hypothetical protein